MPKVISYTIQDPTLQQIKGLSVSRQSDGKGGTEYVLSVSYELIDNNAPPRVQATGSVDFSLTPQQVSAMATFITSLDVVGAIKAKEGL